jgi:magnesium chelatase family protein
VAVARVACRGEVGLDAPLVQVEVSLASGLPAFCIVGLPATVVKESKERVRAALLNSRFEFPAGRITVSLAPAELPKEGGRFDLPIALGILVASGQVRVPRDAARTAAAREFYGELGLSGVCCSPRRTHGSRATSSSCRTATPRRPARWHPCRCGPRAT